MRALALPLLIASLPALVASSAEAQRYRPPSPRVERGARLPAGPGRLRNAAQGLCLDVEGWNAQGSGNVLLWECNNDPDQVWAATPAGELINAVGGVCLDAAGYAGQRGANVGVYGCERLNDQRWTLVPRGGGTFELHNRKQGQCLDVNGRAGARGDNVLLWSCDGGRDQLWTWEPWAGPPPNPYVRRHHHRPGDPPEYQDPPPPPAPPPPVAAPAPMGGPRFQALLNAVANEGFSSNKLDVIEQAAATGYFRVAQLKQLVQALSFSADKIRAVELVAPRLVDPQNAFTLYDAFSFSSDKDKARQILRRNGY